MAHKVRYTPKARADLDAIVAYIAADDPPAALRVKEAIEHTIDILAEFPQIGARTERSRDIRGVPTARYPYRIYYRIRDNVVLHMRRRPWRASGIASCPSVVCFDVRRIAV